MIFLRGKRMTFGKAAVAFAILGLSILLLAPPASRHVRAAWSVRAAREALSRGASLQAVSALRSADRLQPNDAQILYLLGRALRRTDQYAEASDCFDRAARAGWPESDLRDQRCLMLAQAGLFDEAGPHLEQMLLKGCADDLAEEIYEARCKGYLATYRLSDALLCLDFWLKWRPHTRNARIWRADIWERNDRWRDAAREYRAILEYDPRDTAARAKLGDALLSLDDAGSALAEYENCLAIRPDDASALLGVAKCRRRTGQLVGVKDTLLALLEHRELTDQQRGDVLSELGELALYEQHYEEAFEYLSQVRTFDPMNRRVFSPLAAACARMGKTEMAAQMNRRGSESQRRFGRLAEITDKVVERPDDADLRYEAGMILFAEGLKKEGATWLQTALSCDQQHQKSHAALAQYYAETGDQASAARHRKLAGDTSTRHVN